MLWSRSRIPGKWVLENYGTWEKPSDRAAELSTLSFRRHHEARPVCGSRIEDFHEFGEGHTLYFFFLKFVQRIFFIMFIFYGLPTIAINVLSNFYGVRATSFALKMKRLGSGYRFIDAGFARTFSKHRSHEFHFDTNQSVSLRP